MQYPGVFAGLIQEPSDAWLFAQINGGNCVSLALNKGYGWAGDVNLQFIFEKLFSVEFGCGYPEHRKVSQQNSRARLERLSGVVHLPFDKILEAVDREILDTVLRFPGVRGTLDIPNIAAPAVRTVLSDRCGELNLSI
jgi:hypothetical protein